MSEERIGFVAIGRNEGERLRLCLRSLHAEGGRVVYVDSGSTDGSVEFARSLGGLVVELDPAAGFTMARARNAGWRALVARWPDTEWIHFLDGDCELVPGWVAEAHAFLAGNPGFAVVCGRRRERFPERSMFNRLCESEWNTPVGEAKACGGDALMRREALEAVGGFNEELIAGEEPEMCRRMRVAGWRIQRLAVDMTRHDANILRWSQWWRRCVRGGYGAADVAMRTAGDAEAGEVLFASQVRSCRRWVLVSGAVLLAAAVAIGFGRPLLAGGLLLAWLGAMTLQVLRITFGARRRCGGLRAALEYGALTFFAKGPQFVGIAGCRADRRRSRKARIIEYKT